MISDMFSVFISSGMAYLSDFPYEADLFRIACDFFGIAGVVFAFFFPFALVYSIVRRVFNA